MPREFKQWITALMLAASRHASKHSTSNSFLPHLRSLYFFLYRTNCRADAPSLPFVLLFHELYEEASSCIPQCVSFAMQA